MFFFCFLHKLRAFIILILYIAYDKKLPMTHRIKKEQPKDKKNTYLRTSLVKISRIDKSVRKYHRMNQWNVYDSIDNQTTFYITINSEIREFH